MKLWVAAVTLIVICLAFYVVSLRSVLRTTRGELARMTSIVETLQTIERRRSSDEEVEARSVASYVWGIADLARSSSEWNPEYVATLDNCEFHLRLAIARHYRFLGDEFWDVASRDQSSSGHYLKEELSNAMSAVKQPGNPHFPKKESFAWLLETINKRALDPKQIPAAGPKTQ